MGRALPVYLKRHTRATETNTLRGISNRMYTYDDEDRLVSAGSAEYDYDYDGFLTTKTVGTDVTEYD